jgi:geranylgeranyl diphosphate synthase type II
LQVLDIISRCGKCVGALGLVGGQVMDIQSEGNKDVTIETLQVPPALEAHLSCF